jgi:type II secretory pathway component GspD/PulD (secretin)
MSQRLDARRTKKYPAALAAGIAALLSALACSAQETPKKVADEKYHADTYLTIPLHNATSTNEENDLTQAIRNALPNARVYLNNSAQMLAVSGSAEEVERAQKMAAAMDLPQRSYRLTYTLTELDNGKRTSSQRYVLIAAAGERVIFKQGNRIPIVTGTFDKENSTQNTQVQYLDVGLTIEARADGSEDGAKVSTKVEEAAVGEERSGFGAQDPVIHQTELNGASMLTMGKPLVLGSLDVPGSTRRMEVELTAELVR